MDTIDDHTLNAGRLRYGQWTSDEAGLPCFDGHFDHPEVTQWPFTIGLSTGRIQAFINRWGVVHLFTTEGGYRDLSANRGPVYSGLYGFLGIDGHHYSLDFDALAVPREVRYGVGYVRFRGRVLMADGGILEVVQEIFAMPDAFPGLGCRYHLRNAGNSPVDGKITLGSDMDAMRRSNFPERVVHAGPGYSMTPDACPDLGNALLLGPSWLCGQVQRGVALTLTGAFVIGPGQTFVVPCVVGISREFTPTTLPVDRLKIDLPQAQNAWAAKLERVHFDTVAAVCDRRNPNSDKAPAVTDRRYKADLEPWMVEEARWCHGQLLSFVCYDSSLDEFFPSLGGYGWPSFGIREVAETAIALADFDPDLARQSLRVLAKLQRPNGDIPHSHNYTLPAASPGDEHLESDTEIWFVMACGEVAAAAGDGAFLDESIPFRDGSAGSLFEHCRRACDWILRGIGTGSHGLIRIAQGDWNDYLSRVGAEGRGESVMNSGMACRAMAAILPSARARDPLFAAELEQHLAELREAVGRAFDNGWFVLGYDDEGRPLADRSEDRLYLNSQSWAVLGGCGTAEQRRLALRHMLEKCRTRGGLCLLSRPYPCPPPPALAIYRIPPGEGENGGVWPQTVHWAIWALAEAGMSDEAVAEWRAVSLRHRALQFPDVPFGLFNGPDCYSSHHSAGREGWTQILMIPRAARPPMNPAIAWQAFSLKRIEKVRAVQTDV